MKKFRNQFEDVAINVEFWWLGVGEILTDLAVDDATQQRRCVYLIGNFLTCFHG
jgi:hypothetical protein